MVIHFNDSNICKIDLVCNWLKKNISNSKDFNFTRGDLRDYIVDTVFSKMSEETIKHFLIAECGNYEIYYTYKQK